MIWVVSDSLSQFVSAAVRVYDPGTHPMAERIREIVAEHGMLPLHFDMAYCVGIRADLTVWGVLWEDWGDAARVSDGPRLCRDHVNRDIALIIGSDSYPELRELLPIRPSPAPVCPACDETGVDDDRGRCVVCHGLGWIPERWCESDHFNVDLSTLVWR